MKLFHQSGAERGGAGPGAADLRGDGQGRAMIGAVRAGMRPERDERPETSEVIVLDKVYLGPSHRVRDGAFAAERTCA